MEASPNGFDCVSQAVIVGNVQRDHMQPGRTTRLQPQTCLTINIINTCEHPESNGCQMCSYLSPDYTTISFKITFMLICIEYFSWLAFNLSL